MFLRYSLYLQELDGQKDEEFQAAGGGVAGRNALAVSAQIAPIPTDFLKD